MFYKLLMKKIFSKSNTLMYKKINRFTNWNFSKNERSLEFQSKGLGVIYICIYLLERIPCK